MKTEYIIESYKADMLEFREIVTDRIKALLRYSKRYYLVTYIDGEMVVRHELSMQDILSKRITLQSVGIKSFEQCWDGINEDAMKEMQAYFNIRYNIVSEEDIARNCISRVREGSNYHD